MQVYTINPVPLGGLEDPMTGGAQQQRVPPSDLVALGAWADEVVRIISVLCSERCIMYKQAFGKNFSTLLKERGWSKTQASTIFEVSESMIYHYMAGSNLPEGQHLARMADILGVSIDFLVGRTTIREVNRAVDTPPEKE